MDAFVRESGEKERKTYQHLLRPKLAHETINLQQKWGIYPFIESKNKIK